METIKKYWETFRGWKPRIWEIALTFVILSLMAGIANEKEWLFPLVWVEGNGINYLDMLSILFTQLMILKRISHKDYDPS